MNEQRSPVGFRLLTPDNWVRLELGEGQREASLDRFVASQPEVDPQLEPLMRQMRAMMLAELTEAADNGAVYTAVYQEVLEGCPIGASLVAVFAPYPVLPDGSRVNLTDLANAQVNGRASARVVGLPSAGPAVLATSREMSDLRGSDGRPVQADTARYFVPAPESDKMLVLSFSTVTLLLGEQFRKLFRAIAETLTWDR